MADEARNYAARPVMWPIKALKSLDAKNTTGAGTAFTLPHAAKEFTVELNKLATGATKGSTKATVQLQGKASTGSTWFALGSNLTITTTAGALTRSTNGKAVHYARLSVVSFTTRAGSTSPDKNNVTAYVVVHS